MKDKLTGDMTAVVSTLEKNGSVTFVPSGRSMWPFIKNHTSSVIIEKNFSAISPLDVILYVRNNGAIVLHRVININGESEFIVSGDSQITTEIVNSSQILGVMTYFSRGEDLISCNDSKYRKKVAKYYKRKFIRRVRIKLYNLRNKNKGK